MLTEKQKDLLLFIHARMQERGVPPSFDEMKDALDLRSKSGIHRLITALVERGFIRRLPHRARAIEVIKLPDNQTGGQTGVQNGGQNVAPNAGQHAGHASGASIASMPQRGGFQPSVIEGSGPQGERFSAAAVAHHRCADGIDPRHGPDRCRYADQRHSEPHARHRRAARYPDERRTFRARGQGRLR